MLWRPPRRSWCMHRILCTACNRNSTRSFERGHDGNILEEAYRGRYARQRLLNFWPESSCGYHAIKRFVCIIQVPRLQVYCRVIDPDFRFDCSPIDLLPDLDCLHLLALLGLVPAHRAFHELIGVDDQLLAVPETNGVAVIKGITILRWRVTATIGINPPDIVDSLGRQPGLLRPDDELPQERNNQPTRKARRTTVAEIHVVPDAGSLDFSAFFYGLRSRRRKLPKYALRSTSEKRAAPSGQPQPPPIRQLSKRRRLLAAVSI